MTLRDFYWFGEMGMGNDPICQLQQLPISRADVGEYIQWLRRRRRRIIVRDVSMLPTLMPGDTVLVAMGAPVKVGDIAIAVHPAKPDTLIIKRVQETFFDGGVYLISDNAKEPSARDSRHFGVFAREQIVGHVTSRLASAPVSNRV